MEPMSFWPQTFVGWFSLVLCFVSLLVTAKAAARYFGIDSVPLWRRYLDGTIPQPEPEILDPLEEEFRALEAQVEARHPIEQRLRQMQSNIKGHIATGTLRCSHSRLYVLGLDFICRDCKQVVKTRAKPLA